MRGSPAVVILPNSVLVNVVFGAPTAPKPLICLRHAGADVIEQVERLEARLELAASRHREPAGERGIHSPGARRSQCVTSKIAIGSGRRRARTTDVSK